MPACPFKIERGALSTKYLGLSLALVSGCSNMPESYRLVALGMQALSTNQGSLGYPFVSPDQI